MFLDLSLETVVREENKMDVETELKKRFGLVLKNNGIEPTAELLSNLVEETFVSLDVVENYVPDLSVGKVVEADGAQFFILNAYDEDIRYNEAHLLETDSPKFQNVYGAFRYDDNIVVTRIVEKDGSTYRSRSTSSFTVIKNDVQLGDISLQPLAEDPLERPATESQTETKWYTLGKYSRTGSPLLPDEKK